MPHLARIGRKSPGARLLIVLIYALLTLGGATMVVPFLLWVSQSFKSEVDNQDLDLVPGYWYRRDALMRKYLEQQANHNINLYNFLTQGSAATFRDIDLPKPASAAEAKDYREYVGALPATYTILGGMGVANNPNRYGLQPAMADYLAFRLHKYGSQEKINLAYKTNEADLIQLKPPYEQWMRRTYQPLFDRQMTDFLEFKQQQPIIRRLPAPGEGIWGNYLRVRVSADVAKVNAKLHTAYRSTESAPLPSRYPVENTALAAAWEDFVRQDLSLWYVRMDTSASTAWSDFLRRRYQGEIALYNRAHDAHYTQFIQVPLPASCPQDTAGMGEWNDFITRDVPITAVWLDTPEARYRQFLRTKYSTVEAVNAAYGTSYADWAHIVPPVGRVLAQECQRRQGEIRRGFAGRNYAAVIRYLVTQGRSFVNTIIYVLLALLFTLTINPMAAYVLSRFKLSATNKILLFLLATMAFPAEIAMIPNFLLLKELNLLNTFWALVLPGMASGFSIFLLKGMFDGLPQDLYEAAELDGAGELTIFWRITMPLIKPFLAYLSLGAFIGAYSAFAFAFILCPNPKMWTLMVYLQQMEQWASQPIQFAAFVLASIPTLIVFVTCQRVIMQGIVLPTEK